MRNRKIFVVAVIVVITIFTAMAMLRESQMVKAQSQTQPPPVPDRTSFGAVGITSGQTLRVSVSNTIMPSDVNLPPGPTRVLINFRFANGSLVRDARTGNVIRRLVDLERGDTTLIDIDYGDLPPGPVRAQIRPVVVSQLPPPVIDSGQSQIPPGSIVSTAEIINNANGRTQFAVFTHPAVIRGFNPQPDPPSEP